MNLESLSLSKRLAAIVKFTDTSNQFYDLCCDHGKLGFFINNKSLAKNVIFVDPVKHIIEKIQATIEVNSLEDSCTAICDNAQSVQFKDNSYISIAGVGTNLGIEILDHLKLSKGQTIILNLNGLSAYVRQYIKENDYKIIDEVLVAEKSKFYEVIKIVRGHDSSPIIGSDKIWRLGSISKQYKKLLLEYLDKKLNYNRYKYLEIYKEELVNIKI